MTVEAILVEDMARHLAGKGGAGLDHLGLDQRVAGLPHEGLAAEPGHLVEQHLARLDVRDDRGAGVPAEQVGRQDLEDLVAVDDPSPAVDDADAVTIAVEGDTDLGPVLRDGGDEMLEVLGQGRVGMVVGEAPVDLREEAAMPARQPVGQRLHGGAGGAVAGVPDDAERPGAVIVLEQARHVALEDVDLLEAAGAARHVPCGGAPADLLDAVAEEGARPEHHLEAVVRRRVVRAGDLDAPRRPELVNAVVEHRRRARGRYGGRRRPPHAPPRRRRPRARASSAARRGRHRRACRRLARTIVAKARPIARASAGNSVSPTMPRMSYSRRIVGWKRCPGSVMQVLFLQE